MQVFKFYLMGGKFFEGTLQELYNLGYTDDDIVNQSFEYEDKDPIDIVQERFYNSFRFIFV